MQHIKIMKLKEIPLFTIAQTRNFLKTEVSKYILESGIKIINEDFVFLYHGTSKKNYDKILKTERFNNGTFFSPNFDEAKRYSMMLSKTGKPFVMGSLLYIPSLTITGGYFVTNEDLYYDNVKSTYVPIDLYKI